MFFDKKIDAKLINFCGQFCGYDHGKQRFLYKKMFAEYLAEQLLNYLGKRSESNHLYVNKLPTSVVILI